MSTSIPTQQIVVPLIRRSDRPLTAAPQHQLGGCGMRAEPLARHVLWNHRTNERLAAPA